MPRLHLGADRRAGSRRSFSSSATEATSSVKVGGIDDTHGSELDQFDIGGEFDYGDEFDSVSRSKEKDSAGTAVEMTSSSAIPPSSVAVAAATFPSEQQETKKPKQSRGNALRELLDSSSSSSSLSSDSDEEEELVHSRTRKKQAAALKKKNAKKRSKQHSVAGRKEKSNNQRSGSTGRSIGGTRRQQPTVSSPKITLASISNIDHNGAKNNNKNKKSTRDSMGKNKKGPMGKPIQKNNKKSNKSRTKALEDDENENENENTENQQTAKRAASSNPSTNGRGKKTKAVDAPEVKKNGKKSKYAPVARLQDTDDDASSEDEEVSIVENATKRRAHSSRGKSNRNTNGNSYNGTSCDNNAASSPANHHPPTAIPVLPLRGLAIDNRAAPSITDDSLARNAFLGNIVELIEGGLDKGVLSCCGSSSSSLASSSDNILDGTVMASLVRGAKCQHGAMAEKAEKANGDTGGRKRKTSKLVQTAVVPRASYLFEDGTAQEDTISSRTSNGYSSRMKQRSWLSEFLALVNDGLGGFHRDAKPEVESQCYSGTKGFAAGDSWGYFADLVDAINFKLQPSLDSVDSNHRQPARPITIFTTDANLFADSESSAHLRGLDQFWKRIHHHRGRSSETSNLKSAAGISSVTIVIVETTSILQMMKSINNTFDYGDSHFYSNAVEKNRKDAITNADDNNLGSLYSPSLLPDRFSVIQCVKALRDRIHSLNQAQHRELEETTKDLAPNAINLQLEFMEGNTVSFQTLLQRWVKESFAQTYMALSCTTSTTGTGPRGDIQGRLSFDMPETLDGITCSISLDLQYTILPNRIDAPATMSLVNEMQQLSALPPSSVEVVQTIPLSSVDSSLIYGVSMCARAGFDSDISRYDEMKILTRQLWKYLGRSDAGLVLRVRPAVGCNDNNNGAEQLFLLVCEEAVEKESQTYLDPDTNRIDPIEALKVIPNKNCLGEAPCHGMLYRYATKSQILRFGNEDARLEKEDEAGESNAMAKAVSNHYLDYIERSLDTLLKTGLNPLLM